jgi:Ca2+/H+ antiporter, TMEM165/GDT1 family
MNINMKLFVSTFVLIFLAELGDKTQLAAMAKSIEGRMTVFLAASLALICSTLIAVLFGDALTRIIPERVLQGAAAILFIVFGMVMLYNLWAAPNAASGTPTEPGRFARFVAQTAIAFEEAAEADYLRLAQNADNETTKSILLALAAEERAHAEQMKNMSWDGSQTSLFDAAPPSPLPELDQLLHDAATQNETSDLIQHAIEHELATAAFYETIAHTAKLSGIKQTMQTLAAAERDHAERLKALQ